MSKHSSMAFQRLAFALLATFGVLVSVRGEAGDPVEGAAAAPQATPEQLDFFETKIRPVLVDHCYECHDGSAGVPDGNLALDRAAGWRQGGDSGPALVPGDAEASLLMSAIRYESLEMPPSGKLPEEVIGDFQRWIESGAADPRAGTASSHPRSDSIDLEEGRAFWAFQPPRWTAVPSVMADDWPADPIDHYVLAQLESADLAPAPDADPRVRLRRLAFDLTGLPPSPESIERYAADPSPEQWQRMVDALLHSPAFAEHWGRHWLDVARYADSNGSDFNATFHDAWRYRDYVVRSFAEDKPFDQFVTEQIAGDLMEAADSQQRADRLVATGFLMLGTKMLSERNKDKLQMDVVDEMVDTVGRAFLGMTLGCARCHDHKFDPVPTEDYYALAGIFRSTQVLDGESQKYVSDFLKRPLPADPEHAAALASHEAEAKRLAARVKAAQAELETARQADVNRWGGVVVDDAEARREGKWQESTYTKPYVGAGYVHDDNKNKGAAQVLFRGPPKPGKYEIRVSYTFGGNRAARVPLDVHLAADSVQTVHVDQTVKPEIEGLWHSVGIFEFADAEAAQVVIRNDGTDGYVIADAVQYLRPEEPAATEAGEGEPTEAEGALAALEAAVAEAEEALAEHRQAAPAPLPQAMAVRDAAEVGDTFVCVRGEVENRGPDVPRGFLRVCSSGEPPQIPEGQSGRLELSRWITDPDNPLTARVIVNRVWMHLFGEGLVRTVDNFGGRGDRPSHPELLDRLAIDFVRDGWSIRRLVRRLVMTRAYVQSSRYDAQAFERDPGNRLLWRASRRRLPAEALRDTLLIASGRLDPTPTVAPMAGFGTLVTQNVPTPEEVSVDSGYRRSLYLPVIRGNLPSLLVTFDFADPDLLVGRREATNVPAQALTLLNNPEVTELCGAVASRLLETPQLHRGESESGESTTREVAEQRLDTLYLWLLQRPPDAQERQMVLEFLRQRGGEGEEAAAEQEAGSQEAWALVAQTLVASTEYRFLD